MGRVEVPEAGWVSYEGGNIGRELELTVPRHFPSSDVPGLLQPVLRPDRDLPHRRILPEYELPLPRYVSEAVIRAQPSLASSDTGGSSALGSPVPQADRVYRASRLRPTFQATMSTVVCSAWRRSLCSRASSCVIRTVCNSSGGTTSQEPSPRSVPSDPHNPRTGWTRIRRVDYSLDILASPLLRSI